MSKKILIVEDDEFLRGLEAVKPRKEGYEVFAVSNSVEAYKIVDETKDLGIILLDLMLPDVDGFTILERVRKGSSNSNVPVVVFSNLSEEKDIERAKKLKISEFMVKSNFNLDELTAKVKELIGS